MTVFSPVPAYYVDNAGTEVFWDQLQNHVWETTYSRLSGITIVHGGLFRKFGPFEVACEMELSDNQPNECFPVQIRLHRETFNYLQLNGLRFAWMACRE